MGILLPESNEEILLHLDDSGLNLGYLLFNVTLVRKKSSHNKSSFIEKRFKSALESKIRLRGRRLLQIVDAGRQRSRVPLRVVYSWRGGLGRAPILPEDYLGAIGGGILSGLSSCCVPGIEWRSLVYPLVACS